MHQLELGLAAQLLVERGERLVEQQHARPLDQRARERDALALAAGELMRLAPLEAFEPHERQHLGNARGDLLLRQAVLLQPEGDIARDGEMRKQRVALEHHVDRPPVRRHAGQILAVEQDAARVRRLEAGEHAQQRGLAAAGRPEQREELALDRCRATAARPPVTPPKRLVTASKRTSGCAAGSSHGANRSRARAGLISVDRRGRSSVVPAGLSDRIRRQINSAAVPSVRQRDRRFGRADRHQACAAPARSSRRAAPPDAAWRGSAIRRSSSACADTGLRRNSLTPIRTASTTRQRSPCE